MGPNGSVFYFVLDNGEWVLTSGPIKLEAYEAATQDTRRKNRQEYPGMLVKCPFDLSIEHEEYPGDIYISNKNFKLFIAVPVDDLILASQIRSVSLDGFQS